MREVWLSLFSRLPTQPCRQAGFRLLVAGILCLAVAGCASHPHVAAAPPPTSRHILFVVDGAGNKQNCSRHLREAAAEVGQPLALVSIDWNHGKCRYLKDHLDYPNILAEGCALAADIERFRRDHPHVPIYMVGYSAGSAVVLNALERLPPQTVERVFLLAPSISSCYDLRPVLPAVKQPLHVHYSEHDWLWMGLATDVLGSTDRQYGPTAARYGFCTGDPEVRARLWQRPWQPSDHKSGNDGGHFGSYGHGFLREHVLRWLP